MSNPRRSPFGAGKKRKRKGKKPPEGGSGATAFEANKRLVESGATFASQNKPTYRRNVRRK